MYLAGLTEFEAQQLIRAELRAQKVPVDAVSFLPKVRVATVDGPRVGKGRWSETTEEIRLSLSPSRLEEPTGNLKLFLGGQPVKNPESNAQGQEVWCTAKIEAALATLPRSVMPAPLLVSEGLFSRETSPRPTSMM